MHEEEKRAPMHEEVNRNPKLPELLNGAVFDLCKLYRLMKTTKQGRLKVLKKNLLYFDW